MATGKGTNFYARAVIQVDGAGLKELEKLDLVAKGMQSSTVKAGEGIKQLGASMALTKQQGLALTYTMNDVVASLASGISPMTILMQQGGQVTQAFGGIAGTFSTLLPYVVRLAPALTVLGVAAYGAYQAMTGLSKAQEAVQTITDMGKAADRAGLSLKEYQKVLSTAARINADPKGLVSGYEKLNDVMFELQKNRSGLSKVNPLEEFGISPFLISSIDKAGDVIELFRHIYNRLANDFQKQDFEKKLEKTFGKELTQEIKASGSEITGFNRRLDSMVAPLNDVDLASAEAARQTGALLDAARERVDLQIGAAWIPVLNEINQYLLTTFRDNLPLIREFANYVADALRAINGDAGAQARNPMLTSFIDGLGQVKAIIATVATDVFNAFVLLKDNVAAPIAEIAASLYNSMAQAVAQIQSLFAGLWASISAGWEAIKSSIASAASSVGSMFGFGGQGYASGGYVSGPGSGTSDSIPARLSNGEFVIRAAAVRKLGVGFLHSLNGLSPGAVGGGLGFANGGLVGSMAGAGGRPVVLNIDNQSFNMRAGADTVDALSRYASMRNLSRASKRNPTRIG